MKEQNRVRQTVYMALSIALCVVGTFILVPGPNGALIHLGSAALYLVAILFGRWYGAVAGGIGSMLFDFIAGLTAYTPFSLIIKGGAGYLVGYFGHRGENPVPSRGRILVATLIASLWTLIGYMVAWWFVSGSFTVAVTNIPFSLMTSFLGILVVELVGPKLYKILHQNE